jgi:RND family efflux transporter MFP subunit
MSARLPGLSGLAVLTLLLGACTQPPPPVDPPPQVLTVLVRSDAAVNERVLPATVLARHESPLGFRVAGRVQSRKVEVGQTVAAGSVLGELDRADYELATRLADDQRRAAEIDLEQAQRDAERFHRLGAEGALGSAEEERQRARAAAAAARLDQARRQLELAQHRQAYTELRAPFAGVVTQLQFEPGLSVTEGQPVLTLADPAERDVVADIPLDLQSALAGMHATAVAAEPGAPALRLHLRELAPQANPGARTIRARFALVEPVSRAGSQYGLGRAVDLHLAAAEARLANRPTPDPTAAAGGAAPQGVPCVLPAAAVVQAGSNPYVFRVDAATRKLVLMPVEVLGFATDTVVVRGVTAGTRVVAAGAQKLHEGDTVAVIERSASGIDLAPPAPAVHP